MDVTRSDDNERAVTRIIEEDGRIDVLINNAGFGLYGPVENISLEDARYQFEVNLFGLAHLTQLVLPHMRAQRSGRIINVSSVVGKIFVPLGAWYVATKHALEGWSDCLRLETRAVQHPGRPRRTGRDQDRVHRRDPGAVERVLRGHRVQGTVRTVLQDVRRSESHGAGAPRPTYLAKCCSRPLRPPGPAGGTSRARWRGPRSSSGSGSATGSTNSCCAALSTDRSGWRRLPREADPGILLAMSYAPHIRSSRADGACSRGAACACRCRSSCAAWIRMC